MVLRTLDGAWPHLYARPPPRTAPFWLGLNTINVNGCTTTLIGSSMFGNDVVVALRDNIEATLRGIMAKAPPDAHKTRSIPAFSPDKHH